jgi:uncharacterized membrane protein YeaQ/YmgE (transglycosylase-associated protein family)
MNIIAWIFLGIVAGALAKLIYPGKQGGGIFSTMALGVAGAFIGGTLHTFITTGKFAIGTVADAGFFTSVGIAIVGAIIAIFIWGLIFGNKAT